MLVFTRRVGVECDRCRDGLIATSETEGDFRTLTIRCETCGVEVYRETLRRAPVRAWFHGELVTLGSVWEPVGSGKWYRRGS